MICFPNCKINLGLFVTGKRPDGYHSLESVFVPVNLHDVLEIVPSPEGDFDLILTGTDELIPRESNICWKALMLLRADYNLSPVTLHLHKFTPSGAGLGGGSADGAFALKLMNDFFELHLSEKDLKRYAAMLGSDCPFFIANRIQLVSGRGELMEDIGLDLDGIHIAIIHPSIHIKTAGAFSLITPRPASFDLRNLPTLPPAEWKRKLVNDFEAPIFTQYPQIGVVKDKLYDLGAFYASMSGSGSAVYGLFHQEPDLSVFENSIFTWQGKL